ncbi:lycopene beta-cyclase CrtY [Xenorhabdus stockiae]|uniref:lycopene beta-cyclase CrtY n=1 Tax=Xenorhabdus stockiae TaxID=351614 RepID=UPI003CEE5178
MDILWDLILVGGGLANGLIAMRLKQCHPNLRVLLIEESSDIGGNHTWSFHQDDLTKAEHEWISSLIAHCWSGYDVVFPSYKRTLSHPYFSITSEKFSYTLNSLLKGCIRTNEHVKSITPNNVTLNNGIILTANAVIDGRGWSENLNIVYGKQAFLGQEWELDSPHGLTQPILMDATVKQNDGYHFIYVLPFSPTRLLIENTYYVDDKLRDKSMLTSEIAEYANQQGWRLRSLVREECGCLPITLMGNNPEFWQSLEGQPVSGMRAILSHPTTGYTLQHAVRLADRIANLPVFDHINLFLTLKEYSNAQWKRQRFFRMLNRMFFLAGEQNNRWVIMQRFYKLSPELISRFYSGKTTCIDKIRILLGKPPIPLASAISAIIKRHPKLKNYHHE